MRSALLRLLAIVGDVLVLQAVYLVSFYLRFLGRLPAYNFHAYERLAPFATLALLAVLHVYGLYDPRPKTRAEVSSSAASALVLQSVLAIALSFFVHTFAMPRSVLLLAGVIGVGAFVAWRRLLLQLEARLCRPLRVLVVGDPQEAQALAARLRDHPGAGMQVASVWPEARPSLGTLLAEVRAAQADMTILTSRVERHLKTELATGLVAAGQRVLLVPDTYDILILGSRISQIDDVPVFELPGLGLSHGYRLLKRSVDVVLSLAGLVATAPLMGLIALAVRLTSGPPVLYRQERVSEGGRRFWMLKFRTMVPDAEEDTGPVLAREGDPRITPIGRILRRLHLDELPQLWNVLKGEMSLVGPRPERPVFVEQFARQIPGYTDRLRLKAGVTGLAQVMGRYQTSPEDKLRYDLLYARAYSPLLDLRILLHTFRVLFHHDRSV